MKTTLLTVLIVLIIWSTGYTQITSPVIKARFGVDADLRTNFFNGSVSSGNDDWFNNGTAGTGEFVIDTTGAAKMVAAYNADISPFKKRSSSFYRGMSKPPFSVIANRLWLDALFVRDYHGTDTTVYTSGSDKNGMSPAAWTGGVQGIPDKNDILDTYVHVRRAGPNSTDSLWMFGALSLDNTTGNRYFDFEMYQTDIYYDRASAKFYGYGPDAGHTSWKFDAAGNILTPGDIIFNGEFQSGSLTKIEARIWVKKSDWQTIIPSTFNWSGQFDGDGSGATYGYASISPNTLGAFYTGLGSANNAWAGPFGLVLQDNSLAFTNPGPASTTNSKYIANQFIEFSVNLTKLGLDPVTLLGGDVCGTPFNRIIIKTRASASFTAELKDFVAPTDLFLAPRALASTETPFICNDGSDIAEIEVTNPMSTSVYQWTTPDGHIVTSPATGPSIIVDQPGTYIVYHYLQAGCNVYATDTIVVQPFSTCDVLEDNLINFRVTQTGNFTLVDWTAVNNLKVRYFEVERSFDGLHFESLQSIERKGTAGKADYHFRDDISAVEYDLIYYRVKMVSGSAAKYSSVGTIYLKPKPRHAITIFPNPVRDITNMQVTSLRSSHCKVDVYDPAGRLVMSSATSLKKGINTITLGGFQKQRSGLYYAMIQIDGELYRHKIVVTGLSLK
ncbi:MAG: T9SS type A sorting domain-containing protein [Pedobacter sp.]|nr:MAG: T9SS type A sorting domain-containing protein [Pedobacter sp.]